MYDVRTNVRTNDVSTTYERTYDIVRTSDEVLTSTSSTYVRTYDAVRTCEPTTYERATTCERTTYDNVVRRTYHVRQTMYEYVLSMYVRWRKYVRRYVLFSCVSNFVRHTYERITNVRTKVRRRTNVRHTTFERSTMNLRMYDGRRTYVQHTYDVLLTKTYVRQYVRSYVVVRSYDVRKNVERTYFVSRRWCTTTYDVRTKVLTYDVRTKAT